MRRMWERGEGPASVLSGLCSGFSRVGALCSHGHGNDATGADSGCGSSTWSDNGSTHTLNKKAQHDGFSEHWNRRYPSRGLNRQHSTLLRRKGCILHRLHEQVLRPRHRGRYALEAKAGGRLQFHGVGNCSNERLEIHLQAIEEPTSFRLGVRDISFSFLSSCCWDAHSPVNAPTRTHPIVIVQREGQGQTWVTPLPEDHPFGRSFSGRASPSRCPRGQSGSERNVGIGSIPKDHPHVLLFPHTNRAFHALDADGSVHIWGKDAIHAFRFALKYPDIDHMLWRSPALRHVEWKLCRIEE